MIDPPPDDAAGGAAARGDGRGREDGLLAGEPLWELPDAELVRRCAAFKAAVCLRDPHDDAGAEVLTSGTRSRTRSRRPRSTST